MSGQQARAANDAAASQANGEERSESPPRERVSYLGFFLGSEIYGLPLEQLREVARVAHLRRVPGAPRGVAGLVNLRGEILCALDTRAILGLGEQTPAESPFLIAMRGSGDPIGLVVDSIADIYAVASDEIEPLPESWPAGRGSCCVGTAHVPAGLMGLLDPAKVVKV